MGRFFTILATLIILILSSSKVGRTQDELIIIKTRMLPIVASVRDKTGNPVADLTPQHFKILVDGKEQPITHFSKETNPITIGFVVDISGSMKDYLPLVSSLIAQFQNAIKKDDKLFLITFNTKQVKTVGFTNSMSVISEALKDEIAQGATPLIDVIHGAGEYASRSRHAKRILVIISDGQNTHAINDAEGQAVTLEEAPRRTLYGYRETQNFLQEEDIACYTIAFKPSKKEVDAQVARYGLELMRDFAEKTNGHFVSIEKPSDQLANAFQAMFRDARQLYVLGFEPKESEESKWHTIKIKLVAVKNAKIHINRRGYFSP